LWLRALLRPPADHPELFPLEQVIMAEVPAVTLDGPSVHLDASLWGAGGVLYIDGKATEYWVTRWTDDDAKKFQTTLGDPAAQTAWEYLAVLLSLIIWAPSFTNVGLAILGDNLASLTGVLELKGKNILNLITRELSWRRVRGGWRYAAGHLPTEKNVIADSLSRMFTPEASERKPLPPILRDAVVKECPDRADIWVT